MSSDQIKRLLDDVERHLHALNAALPLGDETSLARMTHAGATLRSSALTLAQALEPNQLKAVEKADIHARMVQLSNLLATQRDVQMQRLAFVERAVGTLVPHYKSQTGNTYTARF
jgi:hypothetical protein